MKSKVQKRDEASKRQEFHDEHDHKWKLAKALHRGHPETREFKRIAAHMSEQDVSDVVHMYNEEVRRHTYGGHAVETCEK